MYATIVRVWPCADVNGMLISSNNLPFNIIRKYPNRADAITIKIPTTNVTIAAGLRRKNVCIHCSFLSVDVVFFSTVPKNHTIYLTVKLMVWTSNHFLLISDA